MSNFVYAIDNSVNIQNMNDFTNNDGYLLNDLEMVANYQATNSSICYPAYTYSDKNRYWTSSPKILKAINRCDEDAHNSCKRDLLHSFKEQTTEVDKYDNSLNFVINENKYDLSKAEIISGKSDHAESDQADDEMDYKYSLFEGRERLNSRSDSKINRRENQKQIERKYRLTLNERFAELRQLLVGNTYCHKRIQKSGILSRAIEKIKYLEKENAELQKELAESYLLINSYYISSSSNSNSIQLENDSILIKDERTLGLGHEDMANTRVYAFFISVLVFITLVIFRQLTYIPANNNSFGRILRTDKQDSFTKTDNHYSSILFNLTLTNRKVTVIVLLFMAFILRMTYIRRSNSNEFFDSVIVHQNK